MKPSGLEYYICHDCKKGIIPPLGKPFSNGDDKIRCEACAVKYYTNDLEQISNLMVRIL